MVGRVSGLDGGVFVILRMRPSEVATVKVQIVFLFAMIGQRLARNLSSGDAPAIGEYREEQGIHAGAFLKDIQHFLDTLIDEGNRADLDADHFGRYSSMP